MSTEYRKSSHEEVRNLYYISGELKQYEQSLENTMKEINNMLRSLIKSGYYNRVSITFRCRVYETILFYQATRADLSSLREEMSEKITEEHIELLRNMAKTADNLSTSLRFTWKTDSYPEDFIEQRFLTLAHVYKEAASMLNDLQNLETIAENLKEYIGK